MDPIKYKRIILKLSGESLSGKKEFGFELSSLDPLALEIREVLKLRVEMGIVVGGGNIIRGTLASEQGMERVSADYMGMLATVINALALQDFLEQNDIETRVLTAIRMEELAEPYIRRRAIRHLSKGRLVIFAGGTGNPYFSTDTAAVLRAIEVEADLILKGTNVDGVYTADPKRDPDAEFIPEINYIDVLKRELKIMDSAAISLCMDNHLPIVVFNIGEIGSLRGILKGERVGTLVQERSI
jgi:uridylate kinase